MTTMSLEGTMLWRLTHEGVIGLQTTCTLSKMVLVLVEVSGPNGATSGCTKSGTSERIGGAANGDTSSGISNTAVGSLAGVASGVSTFSPIAEFFKRSSKNYKGVKIEKLSSLQEFE
ncbi:hypothetical protein AXG93_1544s1040 [Marchantia polymorpha subsp. ruderalis]|uniref:Uncharacterized protein n=1 Tax=Marchantia polymorpha subsp. ruderalis TaxID=1480154 RepID=A0A176VQ84_MARPO|nr:hypothetical protein AXG93_1544s1040 [Marchantia polymorpha subsp. ruderalis]